MRTSIAMVALLVARLAVAEEGLGQAIASARVAVSRYPDVPELQGGLAELLLRASAGDSARTVARRAVEAHPASGSAWVTLGFVLEHDEVGRLRGDGADISGAEQAYRKACALDPTSVRATSALAELLANAPRSIVGDRAVDVLLHLRTDLHDHTDDALLLRVLLRAGRFKEAVKLSASMELLPEIDGLALAAQARLVGGQVALRGLEHKRPSEEKRRPITSQAGVELLRVRAYPEASRMFVAAATDPKERAAAAELALRRRHETFTLPASEPSTVVFQLLEAAVTGESPGLFAPDVPPAVAQLAMAEVRVAVRRAGDVDQVLDVLFSHRSVASEGNLRQGYRVRLSATGEIPAFPGIDVRVVPRGAGYRIASVAPVASNALRTFREAAMAAAIQTPVDVAAAMSLAKDALNASGGMDPETEWVVAVASVEAGQRSAAQAHLSRSLDLRGGAPDERDWYAYARLYESYGLTDEAVAAYGRVIAGPRAPPAIAAMARRRLDALPKP